MSEERDRLEEFCQQIIEGWGFVPPESEQLLDVFKGDVNRASYALAALHNNLFRLFPAEDARERWWWSASEDLQGRAPIEVALHDGISGVRRLIGRLDRDVRRMEERPGP